MNTPTMPPRGQFVRRLTALLAAIAGSACTGAAFAQSPFFTGAAPGDPVNWCDLHPPAAQSSYAQAISGTQQAGFAHVGFPGNTRASLWGGSPISWIDLHPRRRPTRSAATSRSSSRSGSRP